MDGITALVLVLVAAAAVWRAKRRLGLCWFDFWILRGAFIYSRLWHRWSCPRPLRLPLTGPAILISNHTCSADPTFLLGASDRPLSFLVAREHYHVHWFCTAILDQLECLQVDRTGCDPVALRQALRHLAQGKIVYLFPEGGLSGVSRNRMRRGKPGMALLALVSGAPVIPIYIAGGPRTEKLLYSWLFPSPRAVRVLVGRPVDLSAYRNRTRTRQVLEEVAQKLMAHIVELGPRSG